MESKLIENDIIDFGVVTNSQQSGETLQALTTHQHERMSGTSLASSQRSTGSHNERSAAVLPNLSRNIVMKIRYITNESGPDEEEEPEGRSTRFEHEFNIGHYNFSIGASY